LSLSTNADVIDFRKAVKAEYDQPGFLKDIPASQLLVYENRECFDHTRDTQNVSEPLRASHLIGTLGATEDSALIVVVPSGGSNAVPSEASNVPYTSIPDKLKQLGVGFSTRDINYLMIKDTAKYSLLMSPTLKKDVAQAILSFAKSKIKSATQRALGQQHSIFLGDSLNMNQGQYHKSSLYYAFSESGVVVAAKVYNGHKEDFLREVQTNESVEHKNLVKFIKTFSIQNESRHIIIMPLFPRSVADWLVQDSVLPLTAVKIIARSCFEALCHLHSKGFCFADLKPSNIMLQHAEPSYATLVDYGATVRIGSPTIEFTRSYCLDATPNTATESLDWICLGTTIAQIVGFDIFQFQRASDIVDTVNLSEKQDDLKNLIVSCLQSPSSSKIASALHQIEMI
jgi:serine/threonine protein kinase